MPVKADYFVAMLLYDGVAASDVAGPLECFGLANFISGRLVYEIATVSASGQPVKAAGGWISLQPTHSFETLPSAVDILLVPGGPASQAVATEIELSGWLKARASGMTRLGSICNGTFILAAAGLTRGARVATHWMYTEQLARLYPETDVDGDALFVQSGNLWTSAGMSAGMDLALALIEEDCGRPLAMEVARYMVLYLRRPGGQSQFSIHLKAQFSEVPVIREMQQWIIDNPTADLSVSALAHRFAMSTRNLHRLFREDTGITLGEFISDCRLRHACNLLEESDRELKSVATLSGFGTEANMRKVFVGNLGVPPSEYRARFRAYDGPAARRSASQPFSYDDTWLHRTDVKQFGKSQQ